MDRAAVRLNALALGVEPDFAGIDRVLQPVGLCGFLCGMTAILFRDSVIRCDLCFFRRRKVRRLHTTPSAS